MDDGSIVDKFNQLSKEVLDKMEKDNHRNADFSKLTKSGIRDMLTLISRAEMELDILLTKCDSFGGFCHFYPTYCLEKLKTMRTILDFELKDDVIDP